MCERVRVDPEMADLGAGEVCMSGRLLRLIWDQEGVEVGVQSS